MRFNWWQLASTKACWWRDASKRFGGRDFVYMSWKPKQEYYHSRICAEHMGHSSLRLATQEVPTSQWPRRPDTVRDSLRTAVRREVGSIWVNNLCQNLYRVVRKVLPSFRNQSFWARAIPTLWEPSQVRRWLGQSAEASHPTRRNACYKSKACLGTSAKRHWASS